jgi:calcineurin-like phosphoesterase family protein
MKIAVYGDLHTEVVGYQPKQAWVQQADLVVQSGDLSTGSRGATWLLGLQRRALFVPGNHEYWNPVLSEGLWDRYNEPRKIPKYTIAQVDADFRARLKNSPVTFLQCDVTVIDNVRFLGCTLWSDLSTDKARRAAYEIRNFQFILSEELRLFTVDDQQALHLKHKAWLTEQLNTPFDGKTVVITHFSPTRESFTRSGESWIVRDHYSSDLDHLVKLADVWIHGHIHAQLDYTLGRCRVICNPRGYPGDHCSQHFKNLQLIEV